MGFSSFSETRCFLSPPITVSIRYFVCPGQMALLKANKDLISAGLKEFSVLLNQQVFNDPLISEEDMVTVVEDWMNFYINYYRQQVTGEPQERDKALQELRQELNTLANPFLAKYRDFLKSHELPSHPLPSS
ncbi:alpha-hemoglobin-stabilizing protein isoform X1 [Pongo pygmaeus]|uniref:Alpha-hemoglobin-stabilizing protein n=3 Tax=Pongo abelii TaxID=9601 RepID=H2NS04_PONAB|nr:alpha-hemoglobin-stabilizing protein isoform X1 [Pongo pygmaeus]XP_054309421.1 alpha-hemoglobin-stabilizing protein isoform X1 [Pongo pygmaeus]XP_054389781.1 alpha-hemoglobin-stabilizing protein isoform X1 [Pongo abelii]XP_054389782.1 alpha-hemoglobin-stabilizing protein isoform X1 [Pongo abelii]